VRARAVAESAAEQGTDTEAEASSSSSALVAPEASQPLAPGTEVVLQGLTKCPDFNGLKGAVQSFDEATGRYDILLPAASSSASQRWAKVKRDNLLVAVQPQPPCHTAEEEGAAESLILPAVLPSVGCELLAEVGFMSELGVAAPPFFQEWSWYGMQPFQGWEVPVLPMSAA